MYITVHIDFLLCLLAQSCDAGDVRLSNGATALEGRVEICIDDLWLSVCNRDYYSWDETEANVVCQQINGKNNPSTFIHTCIK